MKNKFSGIDNRGILYPIFKFSIGRFFDSIFSATFHKIPPTRYIFDCMLKCFFLPSSLLIIDEFANQLNKKIDIILFAVILIKNIFTNHRILCMQPNNLFSSYHHWCPPQIYLQSRISHQDRGFHEHF